MKQTNKSHKYVDKLFKHCYYVYKNLIVCGLLLYGRQNQIVWINLMGVRWLICIDLVFFIYFSRVKHM